MLPNGTGNVGIGTTGPGSLLDVAGTAQLRGASGGTGLYVNSSGNVGIGTTSPVGPLQVINGSDNYLTLDPNLSNTFVGEDAGNLTMTGWDNTALGNSAFNSDTTGNFNVAIGSWDQANGLGALNSNTTGSFNTALGAGALQSSDTGSNNTAIGYDTLALADSNNSIAIGFGSGSPLMNWTYGAMDNDLLIGNNILYNNNGNLPQNSIILGNNAAYNLTGSNNIMLGYQAGYDLTGGANNILIGYNTDLPTATTSNTLDLGNLIYATGLSNFSSPSSSISTGNVGIGTTAPSTNLDVSGSGRFYNQTPSTGVTTLSIRAGAGQATNPLFQWMNNSGTGLGVIDAGGNVGIGTTSPGSSLTIQGATSDNTTSALNVTNSGGTSELYVSNNGNVGIGTTSPGDLLTVAGSIQQHFDNNTTYRLIERTSGVIGALTNGGDYVVTYDTTNVRFGVGGGGTTLGSKLNVSGNASIGQDYFANAAPTNGMIIEGNVGIGTTNPTHTLEVNGDVEVSGNFIQNGTNLTVPDYVFQPNYDLMPLNQLQTYVQTNSHLPGVPSEEEIQKNGLNTGSMILDLLQQTEQNVLYILGNHNDIQTLSQLVNTNQQSETADVANLQSQMNTATQNIASLQATLSNQNLSSNTKINLIGTTISQITANQTADENTLKTETQNIASLQTGLQTLEDQMATLEQQNQAILNFAAALNTNSLIYKDASGNLDLGEGQLKAAGVVAGAFTIKVVKNQDPLFGTATIKAGDSSVTVINANVQDSSLINLTLKSDPGGSVPYVSAQKTGQFTVSIKDKAASDIVLNWWILETDGSGAESISGTSDGNTTTATTTNTTDADTTGNTTSTTGTTDATNPTNTSATTGTSTPTTATDTTSTAGAPSPGPQATAGAANPNQSGQ